MANSIYDNARFDALKKTLIDQYHSQLMAHAGYIIALIIGSLTIISRADIFFNFVAFGILSMFALVSFIGGLIFYFTSRLFYWSCLENLTFSVTEKDFSKFHKANIEKGACLANLQLFIADDILKRIKKDPKKSIQNRIASSSSLSKFFVSSLVSIVIFLYLCAGYLQIALANL